MLPRPAPGAALPRYYRINWVVGTAVFTAGRMLAGITLTNDAMVYYPPAVAVNN